MSGFARNNRSKYSILINIKENKMTNRLESVQAYLQKDLYDRIKNDAKKKEMSVSRLITIILEREYEVKGE